MTPRRVTLLAGAGSLVALLLLGGYAILAVASQPLTAGEAEGADAGYMEPAAFAGDRGARWLDYNDGQTVTMTKGVSNTGTVGLTVTGVETSSSSATGLMSITSDFKPFPIAPGRQGVVVFHVLLSHCENSGPGAMVGIDTVKIRYRILGFPHTQDIPLLDRLLIRSPMICPRTGPARPAA